MGLLLPRGGLDQVHRLERAVTRKVNHAFFKGTQAIFMPACLLLFPSVWMEKIESRSDTLRGSNEQPLVALRLCCVIGQHLTT
jgi:hypothetical protein